MKLIALARLGLAAATALALSSCTTTQADLRKNPKAISKATLCRTLVENQDPYFQQEIAIELGRRNINTTDCFAMVQQQNQAAAALVAVALVGTAVAVCANNNCGGGSYYPTRTYNGNCQYDWQYDAAGNRCGKRSAYSRPGGW